MDGRRTRSRRPFGGICTRRPSADRSPICRIHVRHVEPKSYPRYREGFTVSCTWMLAHFEDCVADSDLGMTDAAVGCHVALQLGAVERVRIEVNRSVGVAHDEIRPHRVEIGQLELGLWRLVHSEIMFITDLGR